VIVSGDHAFVSYYQAGVRVLDISDPEDPVEVGFLDPHRGPPTALFQGCWGVDLGAGGEPLLYASDRDRGLFQLRFDGARRAVLAGRVKSATTGLPIPGAEVRLVNAGRHVFTRDEGDFTMATGGGRHRILVSAAGFEPAFLQVEIEPALERQPLEVLLTPAAASGLAETGPVAAPGLRLDPAFPNPSHGRVSIPFVVGGTAAGASSVRLSIHDASGRCLRVLHDGPPAAERRVALWDGRDERGIPVAAGVYFTRIEAGPAVESGRLEILR
jgi:hypothetical protein